MPGDAIQLPIELPLEKELPPELQCQLIEISNQFDTLTAKYDDLKISQGQLSRQIGEVKSQQEDASDLIRKMKKVSGETKTLKKQLDALKHQAREIAQVNKTPSNIPDQPAHFSASRACDTPSSSENLTICKVGTPELAALWRQYTDTNPRCSVYHHMAFKEIIETAFGHHCTYLIAQDSQGVPRGILPGVQLKSQLFGNYMVSMPFFNYGGPIADSEAIEKQLMEHLEQIASAEGCAHIEFRDTCRREGYPAKNSKVAMIRQLPSTAEQLWDDIGAKVRAQVNKANDHNPQVRFGGKALLDDFYKVFSTNMRDLGTPVYSKSFFAAILEQSAVKSIVTVVYIGDKPVAGAFLIGHGDTLEIPWASTLRSFNHTNANMFLYWQVLNKAIDESYLFFDFGRSSPEAGTFRFKKQWGAKPAEMHWHYWLRDGGELPEINPNNPKYKLLIAGWKRLPLWFANILGPAIVKSLP